MSALKNLLKAYLWVILLIPIIIILILLFDTLFTPSNRVIIMEDDKTSLLIEAQNKLTERSTISKLC